MQFFLLQLDCSERDLRYELELTDGWYSLTAVVDQELCQRIQRGTVAVGTKLISYGAELLNSEQGCSPLEVSHLLVTMSSRIQKISYLN
jgi:breast cancer 2 susceptibility protein